MQTNNKPKERQKDKEFYIMAICLVKAALAALCFFFSSLVGSSLL